MGQKDLIRILVLLLDNRSRKWRMNKGPKNPTWREESVAEAGKSGEKIAFWRSKRENHGRKKSR